MANNGEGQYVTINLADRVDLRLALAQRGQLDRHGVGAWLHRAKSESPFDGTITERSDGGPWHGFAGAIDDRTADDAGVSSSRGDRQNNEQENSDEETTG